MGSLGQNQQLMAGKSTADIYFGAADNDTVFIFIYQF
jgi:hypothetical protein